MVKNAILAVSCGSDMIPFGSLPNMELIICRKVGNKLWNLGTSGGMP